MINIDEKTEKMFTKKVVINLLNKKKEFTEFRFTADNVPQFYIIAEALFKSNINFAFKYAKQRNWLNGPTVMKTAMQLDKKLKSFEKRER